jgi:nitroreductase
VTRETIAARFKRHPEPAQALTDLLVSRFSCRAYRADVVARETIEDILALSQLSASWSNVQPWQVLITEGAATREFGAALYDYAQRHPTEMAFDFDPPAGYDGIYDERRKRCGIQLYTALGIQKGDRAAGSRQMLENFRFFGAPHVAIITTDRKLGVYGAIDCGAYLGAFILAAQSFGVASTAQASLGRYGDFVREHFAISANRAILFGISFGFADEQHPANAFRTHRAGLNEVVTFVAASGGR